MAFRYEYALYKGDKFMDVGTASYLANEFGVTTKTIKFLASPSALKRRRKGEESNTMVCVRIDMNELEREIDENIL